MTNRLFYGDNLRILRDPRWIKDESVDLIYLDPPFNSKRSYNILFATKAGTEAKAQIEAFDDTWHWTPESEEAWDELTAGDSIKVADAMIAMRKLLGENDVMAYLVMMTQRLVEMYRVLKPTGSLFLHCDPTASHYLKIVLDAIFDPRNFRNEIVWHYTGWNKHMAEHLERRHDIVLFYAKSKGQKFNGLSTPWKDEAEYIKTRKQKVYTADGGRRYVMSDGGGGTRVRRYLDEAMAYGRPADSVWTIDKINNSAAESLGYPTQKPLELLERIITMASDPGDVILDPFCGCGTTVDAAQKLGRTWIGIDITFLAIDLIQKRLRHTYGATIKGTYELTGVPREMEAAQAMFDKNPLDFERWAVSLVGGRGNKKQVGDKGIDGIVRFYLNEKKDMGEILVSVKGGRQLNPAMVRELRGTVERQKAAMGLLIILGKVTAGMKDEADHSGLYTYDFSGAKYPRLQIVTIADLLAGKKPNMPTPVNPLRLAKKRMDQLSMLDGDGDESEPQEPSRARPASTYVEDSDEDGR